MPPLQRESVLYTGSISQGWSAFPQSSVVGWCRLKTGRGPGPWVQ